MFLVGLLKSELNAKVSLFSCNIYRKRRGFVFALLLNVRREPLSKTSFLSSMRTSNAEHNPFSLQNFIPKTEEGERFLFVLHGS